jgi:hypothetical protein
MLQRYAFFPLLKLFFKLQVMRSTKHPFFKNDLKGNALRSRHQKFAMALFSHFDFVVLSWSENFEFLLDF